MSVAQNVSGNLTITARLQQVQTSGAIGSTVGGGSLSLSPTIPVVDTLINSTGVAKGIDQLYSAQLTLAAATTTLHFETATAHDPFGNTLAMLRIRLLLVQNITTTSGFDVKVESSSANGIAWLPPSTSPLFARANFGLVMIYDPNTFGAASGNYITSTTDGMTLDPGANTVVVNVIVAGTSVA